jgi:hypothetical protein
VKLARQAKSAPSFHQRCHARQLSTTLFIHLIITTSNVHHRLNASHTADRRASRARTTPV